jgi:hypothetical protein
MVKLARMLLSLVNYSLLTKSWVSTIYHFTVVIVAI